MIIKMFPSLRKTRNLLIFCFVVTLTIFIFRWIDGYKIAVKQQKDLSFLNYINTDAQQLKQALKTIPEIIKEFIQSSDKIKIGSLNKISEALEIYKIDHDYYPEQITDLLGTYLEANKTNLMSEQDFYYYTVRKKDGFEMGILLSNGQAYKITR